MFSENLTLSKNSRLVSSVFDTSSMLTWHTRCSLSLLPTPRSHILPRFRYFHFSKQLIFNSFNLKRSISSTLSKAVWNSNVSEPSISVPHFSEINFSEPNILNEATNTSGLDNFFEKFGFEEANSKLFIKHSKEGRGLFANEYIEKNSLILKVHIKNMITKDKLPNELFNFLSDDISQWCCLSLFILLNDKYLNPLFKNYKNVLPLPHTLNSTVLWSEGEKSFLPFFLKKDTEARLEMMKAEYESILPALKSFPHLFEKEINYDRFIYAYCIVCSRSWFIEELNGLSLLPYVDFFNHNPLSKSLLCYCGCENCAEIVSDQSYEVGNQVNISYGEHTNFVLALDFGFALEKNIHDIVQILFEIPKNDHLFELKQKILFSHNLIDNHDSKSAYFECKLISSPLGRGKGLSEKMRAFSRILSLNSKLELISLEDQAKSNEGRIARFPLRGQNKEANAMKLLLDLFESNYENLRVELCEDEKNCLEMGMRLDRFEILCNLKKSQINIVRSIISWLRPRATVGGLTNLFEYSRSR